MSAPIFEYMKGSSDLVYFQDVLTVPDTTISRDDPPEIALAKYRKRLSILISIQQMVLSGGFRAFEEIMMMRLKGMDFHIWPTLEEQDKKKIDAMVAEHKGIVKIFEALASVNEEIDKMQESITSLESGDDPRNPIQEEELNV